MGVGPMSRIDRAKLRALLEALPPEGQLTLSRDSLLQLTDCSGGPVAESAPAGRLPEADLTPEEFGAVLHRSPVTVRSYCNAGLLPGAYRLRGRQWRIPRAALEEFQESERKAHETGRPPRRGAA